MRYGMDPLASHEEEQLAEFISQVIQKYNGDNMVVSMLASIGEADRAALTSVRRLVAEGADYYLKDDLKRSLEAYDNAAKALENIDSPFDRVWLNLNRASSEIRI